MKKLKLVLSVTMLLSLLIGTVSTVLAGTPGFQQQHHQFRNVEEKWTKGAINFINSNYAEGDSVPYRYEFKDVPAGACIQMEIHYDFSRGKGANTKYAFDFLTNVKRTETTIDLFSSPNTPLTGLSEATDCNSSALQIPDDSDVDDFDGDIAPQYFTLCGSYNPGATETYVRSSEPDESTTGQNTEKSIELQIRAGGTGDEVVDLAVAWGGHLADEDDWGAGKGAGSISGAPYHMRGNGFLDVGCDGEFTKGVDRHFDDGDRAIQIRQDGVEFGTITIVKDAVPNDPQDFQFTGELGDFVLDDDDDGTLPNSQTFEDLFEDTYEVQELVPDGWKLADVVCTKDNQPGPPNDDYWIFDDDTDTVSITLGPGEEITCIFTNNPEGEDAITLASFTARAGFGAVTLAWETGTEVDNAGFNLYRAKSPAGPYTKVNGALIAAQGDAVGSASYSYVDTPGGHGTFYYKLEDVDLNGVATQHGPVSATVMPRFRRPVYRPMWPRF
jgi:hypothetical protein